MMMISTARRIKGQDHSITETLLYCGQDSQKVMKPSPTWEKSPHWTDLHQNLHECYRPRRNRVCRVSKWTFRGYAFTVDRIFHFPITVCTGLTACSVDAYTCEMPFVELDHKGLTPLIDTFLRRQGNDVKQQYTREQRYAP